MNMHTFRILWVITTFAPLGILTITAPFVYKSNVRSKGRQQGLVVMFAYISLFAAAYAAGLEILQHYGYLPNL